MEVKDALKARHSCRKFEDKKLPTEVLETIMWAGSTAPYASGGPRREFIATSDPATKNQLMDAAHGQRYVGECSTVVVVCGKDLDITLRSGFPKFVHDCDAAMSFMILMATSLSIGSCWIGHFRPQVVQQILGCKSRPVALLLLGYEKNG